MAARSASLEHDYWSEVSIYNLPAESLELVAEKLLQVGRTRDAVHLLGHKINKPPSAALLVRALRAAVNDTRPTDSNDTTMFGYSLGLILDYREGSREAGEREIVELEWIYFSALQYSRRPPRSLYRALAREPNLFVDLVKLVYLPEKDSGVEEPPAEDSEHARGAANQAWNVLHDWAHVPGADDSGKMDASALEVWVKKARKLLAEAGRGEIGDIAIGEILAAAPRRSGKSWPPEPVRDIIEMTRSRALARGFETGVYNRRGVTVRMPFDGGEQERELASHYRRDAEAFQYDWPRTAACLNRIADSYEDDAKRHDQSAEQND